LVDTVSAGEIHRALAAGYSPRGDPPPIVYTADIFDRQALELVVEQQVHVNIGSPDMIDQLADAGRSGGLTIRVNPGFGHGHSRKTNTGGEQSKHGVWHEQLVDCVRQAQRRGFRVSGLHMHIGSGADLDHLARVCQAMEQAALAVGSTVSSISAGGGLPTPYRESESHVDLTRYYGLWHATRERLEKAFGHSVSLEIEPGRFLIAESGYLISQIRAVKRMGGNTFYLVDAGFNNLARPILYGAYHPISIAPLDGAVERPSQQVVVGGPLCESGDIFTQEEAGFVCSRTLPAASVGDYLIIERAGAYGFVMSSNYNSKPLAAEVLIREGQPRLVRARQTLDDLLSGERIPED
jgi:diaminopimelate decarboxylase